jgi:hypothetical protein
MAKKVEQVSTVTNTFFAALEDKSAVRIAGIVSSIQDKETSSGTAKRFKGDIAVEYKETVFHSRYLFLPTHIRDAILNAVSKIGKWESFEFLLSANKVKNEKDNKWEIEFDISPRVEKPRVLALLED